MWRLQILHDVNSSGIEIKDKRGLKTEPCGALAVTFSHDEICPFKAILCWHAGK